MIKFFQQKKNTKILRNMNNYFEKDSWVNGNITFQFEKKLKDFLNVNHNVISCNSGSDALLISLMLNKKPGKNIYLTTPISYIASASIPRFLNLQLIYIDVRKNNFLMCLDKLEEFLKSCPKKIKRKINGIINVELFGQTCNLDKLQKISKKHNLSLIGDCAQSIGTKFKNKSSISYYDYASTSFYPTKILSCYGDGGALFFKENYKKALLLKNNGHDLKDKSSCLKIGMNSRLDSLQAFVLLKEINQLKKTIFIKQKIFNFYQKLLTKNKFINKPIHFDKNIKSNNYIYPLLIKKKYRTKFLKSMKKKGIECKIFYTKLLSDNKLLKPIVKTDLTNAKKCLQQLFCLPSHENLKKKELIKIVNSFNKLKF